MEIESSPAAAVTSTQLEVGKEGVSSLQVILMTQEKTDTTPSPRPTKKQRRKRKET